MHIHAQHTFLIDYLCMELERLGKKMLLAQLKSTFNGDELLRALFNVRPPVAIDEAFLNIQDLYLQAMAQRKGIIALNTLKAVEASQGNIYLWQGDITRLAVDAIVNAANSQLVGCFVPCHNCIDNIIHTSAGVQLRLACAALMAQQAHEEETGKAKITSAYNLPAKHVIHTVGPIVEGKLTEKHEQLLASAYTACLECAAQNGLQSLAFCCISTGVFRFPAQRAAQIAIESVADFFKGKNAQLKVIFNVFKDSDYDIYRHLLGAH